MLAYSWAGALIRACLRTINIAISSACS